MKDYKKAGKTLVKKYGTKHMQKISAKGGQATKELWDKIKKHGLPQ